MTNSLPPDLAAFVQASVAAGRYDSPDAVVVAGIRLLQERAGYDEYVRRELQIGLDELERGEGRVIRGKDELLSLLDEVKRRGREQLAAEQRVVQ